MRPAGEDPHAFGLLWYEKLASGTSEDERALTVLQADNAKSPPVTEWVCGSDAQARRVCLEQIIAHRNAIEALLRENDLVLQRFAALLRYPHLVEPFSPASLHAPTHQHPHIAVRLSQARSGLDFADGKYEKALGAIEQRWRAALKLEAGAASLLTKMTSIGWLRQEQALLSEMLARGDARFNVYAPRIGALLAEFDALPHGFEKVWHYECRMFSRTIESIEEQAAASPAADAGLAGKFDRATSRIWRWMTYRQNRTLNDSAELCDERHAMSRLPPVQMIAAFAAQKENNSGYRLASWRTLRNPVGRIFVSVAAPGYGNYVVRAVDLQGANRLVRLQAALAAGEKLSVALSRAELADPYTLAQMSYDATARTVSFTQRQPLSSGTAAKISFSVAAP